MFSSRACIIGNDTFLDWSGVVQSGLPPKLDPNQRKLHAVCLLSCGAPTAILQVDAYLRIAGKEALAPLLPQGNGYRGHKDY